jgi:hypothetical protein
MAKPFPVKQKDPQDVEDYYFIFEPWLDGETLTLAAVTVTPVGLTAAAPVIESSQVTVDDVTYAANTVVRVRLSAGTDNVDYVVTCRGTSSGGRVKDKSATFEVRAN